VPDLLDWLTQRFPDKDTESTLSAFTQLVFSAEFTVHFTDKPACLYKTSDGELEGAPVELVER